jgi:hypothetical protein
VVLLLFSAAAFVIWDVSHPFWILSFSEEHEILGQRLVRMMRTWQETERKESTWPSSIESFAKEAGLPGCAMDQEMLAYRSESHFLCFSWTSGNTGTWLFPAAGKPIGNSSQLVLASPMPFRDERKWVSTKELRVVLFSDGTAKTVTENEFQSLLKVSSPL